MQKYEDKNEESELSFIVSDEYDPLDNRPPKKYVFKISDSESLEEANFDQIDKEEMISAIIGQQEDEE